jgi:hypothetical protein
MGNFREISRLWHRFLERCGSEPPTKLEPGAAVSQGGTLEHTCKYGVKVEQAASKRKRGGVDDRE